MGLSYGLFGAAAQEKQVDNFALWQLDCVARTMRHCAILLRDKIAICHVFNST